MRGVLFSLGTLNLEVNNFGVSATEVLTTVLRFELPDACSKKDPNEIKHKEINKWDYKELALLTFVLGQDIGYYTQENTDGCCMTEEFVNDLGIGHPDITQTQNNMKTIT